MSFKEATSTIQREENTLRIVAFTLEADGLSDQAGYTISVVPVAGKSTLGPTEYSIDAPFGTVTTPNGKRDLVFYVHLKGDSTSDRDRMLVLTTKIEHAGKDISDKNTGTNKELSLTIKGINTELNGYNYLAYVGTNFDLVDGPKAKNLFFATNIFLPNDRPKLLSTGVYLSLYGNRTVSSIDSTDNVRHLSRIAPLTDTTSTYYYQNADRVTLFSSDNLGAYASGLINLGKVSSPTNKLRLMLAPSVEVVWRRITTTTTYSNATDADTVVRDVSFPAAVQVPDEITTNRNLWEFKYGLGFFLSHETDDLSMRLYFAYGLCTLYNPTSSSSNEFSNQQYVRAPARFFSARAWITERVSGLTLQAEFTNLVDDPRPYFGVTLSKAISFKNLGSVFKPITDR